MRELLHQLVEWSEAGTDFALATVVRTLGSAPNPPGTTMAVAASGAVIGGISGGCVEAALVESAQHVLATGRCSRHRFGPSDDSMFTVGLTCGGTIDVLVDHSNAVGPKLRTVFGAITHGRAAALVTVVDGPGLGARFGWDSGDVCPPPDFAADVIDSLRGDFGTTYADSDQGTVFAQCFPPPPRMIICGAIDSAGPLGQMGKLLGYNTILVDARPAFATETRFPQIDEIVIDWPHRYLDSIVVDPSAVLCVLTHDPKFGLPLLERAVLLPFAYIGAMGSRATCADRAEQLLDRGVTADQLARLHAPIGLDLGGRTPAETALSIIAEIVATRENRSGGPLSEQSTPIHPTAEPHRYCVEQV
ncbi:XdhC family protein [Antrihabitans sp. YC2-6]|uniref:XdhC family protein n=1 Tax=Antrihabitans sp. YC2-6 TaxID=2799498 RepID=UPI0018F2E1E3|nr:XdhC family protein [Antrihabitans sp. YC2-6]MBJ8348926.1 XdhC family protein [Antrihabitans sp. YC2-6]